MDKKKHRNNAVYEKTDHASYSDREEDTSTYENGRSSIQTQASRIPKYHENRSLINTSEDYNLPFVDIDQNDTKGETECKSANSPYTERAETDYACGSPPDYIMDPPSGLNYPGSDNAISPDVDTQKHYYEEGVNVSREKAKSRIEGNSQSYEKRTVTMSEMLGLDGIYTTKGIPASQARAYSARENENHSYGSSIGTRDSPQNYDYLDNEMMEPRPQSSLLPLSYSSIEISAPVRVNTTTRASPNETARSKNVLARNPTKRNPSSTEIPITYSAALDLPPDAQKSRYKKKNEDINLEMLIKGKETRTCVMLRNIPNRYHIENIQELLYDAVGDHYSIVNMPLDPKTGRNLGYCFVQFSTVQDVITAYYKLQDQSWPYSESLKKCRFCYAKIQGEFYNSGYDSSPSYPKYDGGASPYTPYNPPISTPYSFNQSYMSIPSPSFSSVPYPSNAQYIPPSASRYPANMMNRYPYDNERSSTLPRSVYRNQSNEGEYYEEGWNQSPMYLPKHANSYLH